MGRQDGDALEGIRKRGSLAEPHAWRGWNQCGCWLLFSAAADMAANGGTTINVNAWLERNARALVTFGQGASR